MLLVKQPQEAKELILDHFAKQAHACTVSPEQALGRILSEDIVSQEFLPPFDRSMVDGYAVCSGDTFGCSEALPAMLEYCGEVLMGQTPTMTVSANQCVYVPTGGQLPKGADAMVMIEYAEDLHDGMIYVNKPSAPGAHIVFKGDDVCAGALVLPKGKRLRAQDIGVLAALGKSLVPVVKCPVVGILSTGDEVVNLDATPVGAQIRDVNSYALGALVQKMGAQSLLLGICMDEYEQLKRMVAQSIDRCDILLISGGSSVGVRDCTHRVIQELGKQDVLFHGIAIKPGKPTILGSIQGKAVFGLPGHPVSAFYVVELFVRPLLAAMLGETTPHQPCVCATLSTNLPSNHGREEYVSVKLSEKPYVATPVYGKSGMIHMLSNSDGYVKIPRDCEGLQAGESVEVILL